MRNRFHQCFIALFIVFLSGCASMNAQNTPNDPLEPWNRTVHKFNGGVDKVIVGPAATVYDTVTPDLFQHLIGNGLSYLNQPRILTNQLLQGDFQGAGDTSARIFVNGVLGLGLLDPATDFGIPSHNENFDQTLAVWGVGEGYYHEHPLLGPYTTRGTFAYFVDMALDPLSYLGVGTELSNVTRSSISSGRTGLTLMQFRHENAQFIEDLYKSPDSYATLRSAYLQRLRASVQQNGSRAADARNVFEDYEDNDF